MAPGLCLRDRLLSHDWGPSWYTDGLLAWRRPVVTRAQSRSVYTLTPGEGSVMSVPSSDLCAQVCAAAPSPSAISRIRNLSVGWLREWVRPLNIRGEEGPGSGGRGMMRRALPWELAAVRMGRQPCEPRHPPMGMMGLPCGSRPPGRGVAGLACATRSSLRRRS